MTPMQRAAGLELLADHRVLRQGGIQQPLLQPRIVLEHDAEHRDQHQQQREERHEGVVGNQRGEVARLLVAELLPHRDRKRQPPAVLLELVHGAESALYLAHCQGGLPALSDSIRWSDGCYKRRAISSGCRQPTGGAAGLAELELAGLELAGLDGGPAVDVAGVDGLASGDAGPDGLGEACAGGASCLQAAMTTRLPDGSALPPTPPRSTK
jgi:hypothetical protein